MRNVLEQADRLLRGELTRREDLAAGRFPVRGATLAAVGVLGAVVYGACMGLFAGLRHPESAWIQILFTAVKVPLLFFLTLVVCAPSLYVFSALARSRLRGGHTVVLLLACTAVTTTVLASLGPVTVFFTLSTTSHPFMQVLNVVAFAIAGFIGVGFLRKVMSVVLEREPEATAPDPGAKRARAVFAVWIAIYAVVGAQTGWILRPFIGAPSRSIEFLRETDSNIFGGVLEALRFL